MILFARMNGECAPEQNAGYLSQLESSEFYSKTSTLEPRGLPRLIAEDLERCWLMDPKVAGASWMVGVTVWRGREDRELICGSGLVTSKNPSMAGGALLMTHSCFERGPSSRKLKVCGRKMEKQRRRATIPVPRNLHHKPVSKP